MDTNEHDINSICPFCGGILYANYDTPDVIRCDNCDLEMDMWDFVNASNNNIIDRAAHGSSGASELNACEA